MASLPIKPLDGPGGYLRWKESLLLRAHTLGIARVLFESRPAGDGDEAAAAKKWARDDLWRALERTYDVKSPSVWHDRFLAFSFEESTGDVFLEQLAHLEALGAAAGFSDGDVSLLVRGKLPPMVSTGVTMRSSPNNEGMELVWKVARDVVSAGVDPEYLWETMVDLDYQEGSYVDSSKTQQNTASRKRGMAGHVARNCRHRA